MPRSSDRPEHDHPGHGASRREFLARTAAAGAATLFTSSLIADTKRSIPRAKGRSALRDGEPIRMGVIGTGGMGTAHCHAFMNLNQDGREKVHVVAVSDVCDSHLNRAHKACVENQRTNAGGTIDVAAYRDYREMLARDDIHAVLIASPEHWHGQMSREALLAGKDVYCEKPMTLRLDDALHLRQVVEKNPQMIFQVGTQMMMLPKYIAAMKAVDEGRIGTPTMSQTSYCRNSYDGEWLYYAIDPEWEPGVNLDWDAWCGPGGKAPWDPEVFARWRRYKRWSTGIIGDLLVHVTTPLVMAVGAPWPKRIVASGGHLVDKAMENHDQVNINVDFNNGHVMVIAGSTCNEVGLETLIRGHEANLYLGGRHCELRPERIYADDIDPERIECEDIGNDQDQLRLNWLTCIRTREPAVSNVDLATKVMVIVDLATRSMWTGRAWEFDHETMEARAV